MTDINSYIFVTNTATKDKLTLNYSENISYSFQKNDVESLNMIVTTPFNISGFYPDVTNCDFTTDVLFGKSREIIWYDELNTVIKRLSIKNNVVIRFTKDILASDVTMLIWDEGVIVARVTKLPGTRMVFLLII